ncbi:hypothetical protein ASD42_30965 [Nocardia sp. Root136]|nr:hypothetical protein ASD42_30965 [Nocardia sp. Root136]
METGAGAPFEPVGGVTVVMRNEYEATCAMCGGVIGPRQGVVHTRSKSRPYPVLCDSCMTDFDESERAAAEYDRSME